MDRKKYVVLVITLLISSMIIPTSTEHVRANENGDIPEIPDAPYEKELILELSGPTNGMVGEEITFTVTIERGIPPYIYTINYGDDAIVNGESENNYFELTHTYTSSGNFHLTLDIRNSYARGSDYHDILIELMTYSKIN